MPEVQSILEALRGARDLAAFAVNEAENNRERGRARHLQSLIEALRLIYFSPKGVLLLIERMAAGEQPSREQIEAILPHFNDGEFAVERMLRRLDPERGQPDGILSLRAERVLREISYGKGGVREKVQHLLNYSMTYDLPIDRKEAAELHKEVVALNEAIEHAEEALISSL
ncbi:MAG: hypothetical protein AAFQ88_10880 [Pseudomonadota bacterium]